MIRLPLLGVMAGTLPLAACASQPAPAAVEQVRQSSALLVPPVHTGRYK